MKITMKLLDATLIGLLAVAAVPTWAQPGKETPAPVPVATSSAIGRYTIEVPGGGTIWAAEDPTLGAPVLAVQAGSTAPFENGRLLKPVRFFGYSNYSAFIQSLEITLYRGSDVDLATPLATVALPVGATGQAEWDGELPAGSQLRPGDTLLYVTRAHGAEGTFDETVAQRIQLVTQVDHDRGVQALRDETQRTLGRSLDTDPAQALTVTDAIYGRSQLRIQTIPVHGSRVRIHGYNLAEGAQIRINGQTIPVDPQRKFVAEYLQPIGTHVFDVQVAGPAGGLERQLSVDVTGRYMFLVALADVTLSENDANGNLEPLAGDEQFDDSFLSEGRLAFYLKGKVKGRYLITAQADTREREVGRLFSGFLGADARDVFRRLDPDLYYPVYGDDSTTFRDIDTQGRLYVRLDWDRNQALWGNFSTGITGTEYSHYQRSLYGAALDWKSRGITELGDSRSSLRAFGSEAQSALGHSEFVGTGGSLYYLRHTDVLPGTDRVVLEVRDPTTGRTEARVDMQRGTDYEIDELQGRLILTRPLSQVTRENVRSLTRDSPLDGYLQLLMVDYEYVPVGFDSDDVSAGVRGRQWLGDHLAIGGTYIDENRRGDDYSLKGADVTLQAGRGTYLKLEQSRTDSTVAPIFYSDNGGLSFVHRNPVTGARAGAARSVEARANLKELGWTAQDWSTGAWWREVDAGFSVSRFDSAQGIEEHGAEFLGWFNDRISLFGRHTRAERGDASLDQSQLTVDWRLNGNDSFGVELRRIDERSTNVVAREELLAALSYRHRIGNMLELYGASQVSLDNDGSEDASHLLTLGGKYLFGDRSSVGAEASGGSLGRGARLEGEYRLAQDHTLYGGYSYSTDTNARDSVFATDARNGWTLGQRWRLSDQVNVYNESQTLKDTRQGSTGVAHTFGVDLYPRQGWTVGVTVLDGELDAANGRVDRRAYSVSGGRNDPRMQWSSKLEYRSDSGAEQREQWVTTNRLFWTLDEDWRLAARVNFADTQDQFNAAASAKLAEGNLGFAWRPHDNTRWAAFGRYTYLSDLATLGQEGGASYDQRSQVVSLEAIRQLGDQWELAGKAASRLGDYRIGRGTGTWLDSRADFAALQLRYHLAYKWEGLAEYRWLGVGDGGDRRGWLAGFDRQLSDNFKIGLGYNFADFSDDLTDLTYDDKGWFLNLAGYY